MFRKLIALLTLLLSAALTLASVILLLAMTDKAELMDDPLRRGLAIFGTLLAGILLLMGSVYLCTRVAVRLFAGRGAPQGSAAPAKPLR
jgi:hypothetical protein